MSVRIDHLFSRALDGNGDPVSGAKLYVDLAGTTTNVTTYSDAGLTTANSDPVVADSGGNFPAIFAPGGLYKITVTTSADVSVFTLDNVSLFGRLYDRLNVGASDDSDYEALSINGNTTLIGTDGYYGSNIYTSGGTVFVDDGYGGTFEIQDSSGDVAVNVCDAINASGADASATLISVWRYQRSASEHQFRDHSGTLVGSMEADDAYLLGAYADTTANSGNVYVSSGGRLQRSTSSLKYKTDVEPMSLESAYNVLNAEAIFYRSKTDNPKWSWWGFGAEQVADVDPRLVHWGEDGPESVQYDRFVPHLVEICRDQHKRIQALEGAAFKDAPDAMALQERVAALEEKLASFDNLGEIHE